MTQAEYLAYEARMMDRMRPRRSVPEDSTPVEKEIPLHDEIIKFCRSQFPPWKYIHARTDKKATISVGANDFTIFLPFGGLLCVECKNATGKLTPSQLVWQKEMQMIGHEVHTIRSFNEFKTLCLTVKKKSEPSEAGQL